jgi:signal peptidase I
MTRSRAQRSCSINVFKGIRHCNSVRRFVFHAIVRWVIVYQVLTMNPQAREQGGCSLAAEALRSWGMVKLRATGVSMLPTLWPGDLLTIHSRRLDQSKLGDIVLYMRGGRFVIHRVVGKSLTGDEAFLTARGDCMPQDDSPVRSGELLGKITEIQRAGLVFRPARKLSPCRRMVAYLLCHWSLFRRVGLRLRGRRYQSDGRIDGALVGASS